MTKLSRQQVTLAVPVALAALAVLTLPLLVGQYIVFVAALVGAFFVGASALVLLMGHAHQFHLGFAGVLAVGAYTSVVGQNQGLTLLLSLGAAAVTGGLISLFLGFLARWFGQFAVAIVTFGFGIFVLQGVRHFEDLTGGNVGLAAPSVPLTNMYWLAWITAGISAAVLYALMKGWTGRSFRALRDGEVAAELFGLPAARVKVMAFGLTGPFVGLSGALYAQLIGYITPNTFNLTLSLAFVIIIIIGGSTSLWGGFIGSVLWVVTPELTSSVTGLFPIVLGTFAIVTLIWAPGGVVGVISVVASRGRAMRAVNYPMIDSRDQRSENHPEVAIAADVSNEPGPDRNHRQGERYMR